MNIMKRGWISEMKNHYKYNLLFEQSNKTYSLLVWLIKNKREDRDLLSAYYNITHIVDIFLWPHSHRDGNGPHNNLYIWCNCNRNSNKDFSPNLKNASWNYFGNRIKIWQNDISTGIRGRRK